MSHLYLTSAPKKRRRKTTTSLISTSTMEIKATLILMFLLFSSSLASLSLDKGFRVELSHVDSKQNFSKTELIRRAMIRTTHRSSRLNGGQLFSSTNISTSLQSGGTSYGEYYMDLAIGSPAQYYSAIADTGSDLIWTQCNPCKQCVSQPTPIFTPSNSSSFVSICNSTNLSCNYNYTYGTGWTSGVADEETFTFGTVKPVQANNIIFGCSTSTSNDFNGSSGLVGLGRGELSLVSQLNTSKFSYCLTSFLSTNNISPLLLGSSATVNESTVKSTSFVKNPSTSPQSSYYYLSLNGISLGTTKLSIKNTTFALNSNGTGGLIIDSGTTFTNIKTEAYQAVLDGIKSLVKLQTVDGSSIGFDLCYSLSNNMSPPVMPNMTFHFEGADMELPVENYMFLDQDTWCLAMSSSDGLSIFGNYQQQNMHILYDLEKEMLSFSSAQCDKL
ncbi:hypothetical protein LUZ60_010688 [Juncus effusus]|nr:hypothetical protein LUZ60_010688 [Juncus effusus]